MPLTITRATTNAHLAAINTLFTTPVNGTSIVDELNLDWGSTMPMTLAVWGPIMADTTNSKIFMGSQPANTLRGAGWWHLEGGVWMVKILGVDKSLTDQQRLAGVHDFFMQEANAVPGATRYGGTAIVGSKIYNYLSSRLPPERITPLAIKSAAGKDLVRFETTAAETIAVL